MAVATVANFWSHFVGFIDVCLEKTKIDSGTDTQVLGICLMEATRKKFGDGGVGSCWWTILAGWYFLVVFAWKSVGDELTGGAESGMWVTRTGT